jgi:quinoprotein glucose dehydrogenase
VLDRLTGTPVWPIEERAVPQSRIPGEQTSPTQPYPTKPEPFERQGLGDENLIDYTTELFAEAQEMRSFYEWGPLFTPPTERGTLNLPGWVGGANWPGAATDPETGIIYIPSITAPVVGKVFKPDANRSNLQYIGRPDIVVPGPKGLPLVKGPYSRVTAIDLNTGEHLWVEPLGEGPSDHPAIKGLNLGPMGSGSRGYPMITKTLLFVAQEAYLYTQEFGVEENSSSAGLGDGRPTLRAFDKSTGDVVWETLLPASPGANPMTYAVDGKQYIVVGGGSGAGEDSGLIALSLP